MAVARIIIIFQTLTYPTAHFPGATPQFSHPDNSMTATVATITNFIAFL